ncbi:hybrid sensor histidine kinase/response regulator [Deltaproteobacteria bacterium TL4]
MTTTKDPYRYFKIEAQEILEQLNNQFLELEKKPTDGELLNQLFRHAHTLKGAARLVRLNNIGEIAHCIEDIFGLAKNHDLTLSVNQIDTFLKALDVIAAILKRINDAEDPHMDVTSIVELLRGNMPLASDTPKASVGPLPSSVQPSEEEQHKAPDTSSEPIAPTPPIPVMTLIPEQPPLPEAAPELVPQEKLTTSAASPDQETIRITIDKLNKILNLSSELVINKIKLQNKKHQLKAMKTLAHANANLSQTWKEFKQIPEIQELSKHQGAFKDVLSKLDKGLQTQQQIKTLLNEFAEQYEADLKLTHLLSSSLQKETYKARLLPAKALFQSFQRLVRDLSKELGKQVELQVIGEQIEVDKHILDEMKGPLIHLVRNAIDHGLETPEEREQRGKPATGKLTLKIEYQGNALTMICEDDGRGLDPEKIAATALRKKILTLSQLSELSSKELLYLIMRPGFTTAEIVSELSGRGVGLDVVSTTVNQLRGSVTIQSELHQFTRFIIQLPQSLANLPCLLFRCNTENFLLPLSALKKILRIERSQIEMEGTREVIKVSGKATALVKMSQVLKLPDDELNFSKIPVLLVHAREEIVGFAVNRFLGVHEVVVKNLGNHIKKVPNVAGATILGDGHPVVILDPAELIENAKGAANTGFKLGTMDEQTKEERLPILIVDDSLTTRMLEKTILEAAGYTVELAISGEDALEKISQTPFQLFIVDIEMPGLNGFELTSRIKQNEKYSETPVIIVSSLATSEMKRKGIEVGADAYIVKGEFDQNVLLEIIESLI